MEIYSKIADIQQFVGGQRAKQISIGFVPTMGALHNGHVSLIEQSVKANGATIVSIFVNPVQFNDRQDFDLYPRDAARDIEILERSGCDVLFLPTEEEIYPDPSFRKIDFDPGLLGQRLEGGQRPGHFSGVAAVVKRLFDIVKPDRAYFGQKDYQQYLIIRLLAEAYHIPVELVLCPILREGNGLAMSSRNERLSKENRERAALLYATLIMVKQKLKEDGRSIPQLRAGALASFAADGNFKLDYFDICSATDLQRVQDEERQGPLIICVAATIGNVRLIDNVLVD